MSDTGIDPEPIEPTATWADWVSWAGRQYGYRLSRSTLDSILWEQTPFPMSDGADIKAAVWEFFERAGGRPLHAD